MDDVVEIFFLLHTSFYILAFSVVGCLSSMRVKLRVFLWKQRLTFAKFFFDYRVDLLS